MKRTTTLSILVIALIALGGVLLQFLVFERSQPCSGSSSSSTILRSNLNYVQFGAVRKYRLPSSRAPNAITLAPDGSVWFGEQALPGVAQLYPNGTLLEYKWPFRYNSPGLPGLTFTWGIALWKGCVWASDQAGSQLVAVDPATRSTKTIKLGTGSFPYTLTVGPDDSLWFTEVFASKIGRVDSQFRLHEYSLPVPGTPAQIVFANSSLGYYVDTGNVVFVEPAVYSFDPNNFSPVQLYSNGMKLLAPTSLALVKNGLWVAQHASSNLAYYNFDNHVWSQYPTTPVNYVQTNLQYFVAANGSLIWFNEHYANRIGVIDTQHGLLTEYSVSNPPANKTTEIDNALTFAVGKDKVWFTELTTNYVGYVDASGPQSFSFQPATNATLRLPLGGETSVKLILEGTSDKSLRILSSDSETLTARPQQITLNLSEAEIGSLNGQATVTLNLATRATTVPGDYTLLISVTDGLVTQGIYLKLHVSQ